MRGFHKVLIYIALLFIVACHNEPQATIEGKVSEANGSTLYLDRMGIQESNTIDSVKLDKNGSFEFHVTEPECYDFYRLRIKNEFIYLSIDSTETIHIDATLPTFSVAYTVENSADNVRLKELVMKHSQLQRQIQAIIYRSAANAQSEVDSTIHAYKEAVSKEYIYAHPEAPYAYFALFQRIGRQMLFDPMTNRDDIKCFAAVATHLNVFYPNAQRTINLKNIAIKGMKNTRTPSAEQYEKLREKIVESGIIDIELNDIEGNIRRLSELKGKAILLDFTLYNHEKSAARILALRELYEKYSTQGFEIYQVSFDQDEHFWKTAVENLPWVCVRDHESPYSKIVNLYGIRELPTYFLINKRNELVARDINIKDLESEIRNLIAE